MNFVRLRFLRSFVVNSVPFVTAVATVALLLAAPDTSPRLFLLDASALQLARAAIAQQSAAITPAWTALRADADKALALGRFPSSTKRPRPRAATSTTT